MDGSCCGQVVVVMDRTQVTQPTTYPACTCTTPEQLLLHHKKQKVSVYALGYTLLRVVEGEFRIGALTDIFTLGTGDSNETTRLARTVREPADTTGETEEEELPEP